MTEVHWRIIANLGFKFRSHFTALAAAVLLAGGSSRAMLASARVSCLVNISFRRICVARSLNVARNTGAPDDRM